MIAGIGKFGLAALGVAAAMASMSGPSAAQESKAAAPAPAQAAAGNAAKMAKGKELFANYACGGCHALADAGADGHVGPSLDHNPNLTEAYVANRVANGSGPMPAFGDQLSQEEIAALASYVVHASAK